MNPASWLSHLAELALPAALAEAVLKSTLLLSVALLTVRATWRQSPALHTWLLGLALMSIPVVFAQSFLRPGWKSDFALDLHAGAFEAAAGTSGSSEIPAVGLAEMHPAKPRFFDTSLCLFCLWAFGVGVCGVKAAAGFVVRWHHQRSLVEIRRGNLVETLEHARREVGLRHRPRLFLAAGWAMPSTWGILRPAILLPRDASNWPPERLRHVLWHEMAHILRRDTQLSFLAAPALALLWFHPLAWIARTRIYKCRENACDDLVLKSGRADPQSYGTDLLAIARLHHSRQHVGMLAMARSSQVEARLHRILDCTANRSRLTSAVRLAVAVGWLPLFLVASLLISCQGPSSLPAIRGSTSRFHSSVTGTPHPGGETFRFGLIEVSYREGSSPKIENLLAATPPEQSLRWLSQQECVDLAGFPKTREGQSVKMEATDFLVQLSGIKAASGGRAIVDARFVLPAFPGGRSFSSVSIPAGGFVLLPETRRAVSGPKDSGGFSFTAPDRRVLGLVILSPPAPAVAD
jgi:beta-lactamase regulating signal transducer with metallopeptidase domain